MEVLKELCIFQLLVNTLFHILFNYCVVLNWLEVCVIKPYSDYGESCKQTLLDLAILTGGRIGLFGKFPHPFCIMI